MVVVYGSEMELVIAPNAQMDGVRAYLRLMRQGRGVSQQKLANAIGLSRRALIDWEVGRSDEIKTGPLMRAVDFLGASLNDIQEMVSERADTEEGRRRAFATLETSLDDTTQRRLERLRRSSNGRTALSRAGRRYL
jgi:DNA-binding XRE family transcriptional regulator